MRDEREGEGEGEEGYVVDAEVGEVFADARCGLGEGIGAGEGGAIEEFQPGAALGEAVADGGVEARDEGAEGGGGDLRLGLGLGIGDREGGHS